MGAVLKVGFTGPGARAYLVEMFYTESREGITEFTVKYITDHNQLSEIFTLIFKIYLKYSR